MSTALDHDTKVMEMVANQVMHLQRNTPTMSTRGEDLDESMPTPRPKFRVPAKKTTHKDSKELNCQVLFYFFTNRAWVYLRWCGRNTFISI
jgi:hypothetical protein